MHEQIHEDWADLDIRFFVCPKLPYSFIIIVLDAENMYLVKLNRAKEILSRSLTEEDLIAMAVSLCEWIWLRARTISIVGFSFPTACVYERMNWPPTTCSKWKPYIVIVIL